MRDKVAITGTKSLPSPSAAVEGGGLATRRPQVESIYTAGAECTQVFDLRAGRGHSRKRSPGHRPLHVPGEGSATPLPPAGMEATPRGADGASNAEAGAGEESAAAPAPASPGRSPTKTKASASTPGKKSMSRTPSGKLPPPVKRKPSAVRRAPSLSDMSGTCNCQTG